MAYTSQRMTINLYISSIGQKQQLVTKITQSPLIDLVREKTGIKLESIQIVAASKLYGQMIGIPGHPYMILSSKLNDNFTDSEKEYVVLHETGHYIYNHTLREIGFFVVLLIIGIVFLKNKRIVWAPVVAVVFGLLFIQFATLSEYEADRFAVSHISDPNGMITATARFKNDHALVLDDHSLEWKLLYRSTPYHIRVEIAVDEISKRANKNN